MDTSLHLLLMYLCYALGCTKITPDSYDLWIPVELGKEFTATCNLPVDSRYTADDIEWQLGDSQGIHRVPRQFYTRINETAVSVTVNISSTKYVRLICEATKKSFSYEAPCRYGIFLQIGYPPLKPENLTCIALQDNTDISPELKCSWDQVMRDPLLDTTYTLYAKAELESKAPYNVTCKEPLVNSCTVNLSTFPIHMELRVWVTVENALGSELSDSLLTDALHFVKPKPPFNVQVLDEANFSTSLMVTWKHPIDPTAMKLYYVIRYCRAGCSAWTEVPENITHLYTESFRLQSLQPYTKYVVQMRCIQEHHHGYWSDWSPNSTAHTPEARPASKPDLWRIIQSSAANRTVQIIWKNPVKANGKILRYDLELSRDLGISERHQLSSDVQRHEMRLPPGEMALIEIKAANSAGVSPKATLSIPRSDQELPGVEHISWSVRDGLLWLEWSPPPSGPGLSEYLLEWVSIRTNARQSIRDWQRVSANVNSTFISGDLEPYTRYNISVYPMYSHPVRRASTSVRYSQAGRPVTIAAYTQQGPPLEVPTAKVTKNKKTSAELTWEEIPVDSQQGFITNYTIFYRTGKTEKSVTVEAGVYSLVLTDLASESDYVLHIMASTVAGSKNGSNSSFKTRKYGEGEVEVIVVVVCLSFLFLTVFIIMCCLRKREVIKELLWPQVPDPYDSSIANWSPDFQIKADMPKEDVSVVEVDVCDGKSLYEEDKAILPLKKDKYLSEEHSSGIGGSSCMSSPRHSVSDSDEGDSGQTTASTVQYSSVVASGYKGQTPNHQPPVFARSESTQPLLDCEEHPEHEGSGHSRNSYFRRGRGLELGSLEREEPNGTSLTFCPMEEETSPIREDSPTSTSCYMPQQNGYRPQ